MSNNMQSKIEHYLKENQIEYQGIAHAPAASAEGYNRTLNTRYEQRVKVLLVSYKKMVKKNTLLWLYKDIRRLPE